jgi:hypothetical protein
VNPAIGVIVEAARLLSDEELAALVSDLQAIQAARWATAHQTTFEHQVGAAA